MPQTAWRQVGDPCATAKERHVVATPQPQAAVAAARRALESVPARRRTGRSSRAGTSHPLTPRWAAGKPDPVGCGEGRPGDDG